MVRLVVLVLNLLTPRRDGGGEPVVVRESVEGLAVEAEGDLDGGFFAVALHKGRSRFRSLVGTHSRLGQAFQGLPSAIEACEVV